MFFFFFDTTPIPDSFIPWGKIAFPQQRKRIVMSQTLSLSPIDDTVEEEFILFDYGSLLGSVTNIVEITAVSCEVYSGIDVDHDTRLIGSPVLAPSVATGIAYQAVKQLIGTMIGGVTYRLQCVAQTSDGQELSLWTHITCVTPR